MYSNALDTTALKLEATLRFGTVCSFYSGELATAHFVLAAATEIVNTFVVVPP